MIRTFDGEWGGRSDYAKYTLTSYNENIPSGFFCKGVNNRCDYYWPGTNTGSAISASTKAGYRSGSDKMWYWCNVTFNYDDLSVLREKDVKSVKLQVTATLHEWIDVDMKRSSAANSMSRCDKDGNAISSTKLGIWHGDSPNFVSRTGGVCVFDLTNDISGNFAGVPQYGYCWGRNGNREATSYYVTLNSGEDPRTTAKRATLYVVTNERQSTLTFDAQGGSGAPSSVVGVGVDGIFDTTVPDTVPTKAHKVFGGWATTEGGTARYQPGDSITVNGDTTLYAVWDRLFVKVIYLAGSGGYGTFDVILDAGSTFNVVDNSFFLKKDGYRLTGYTDTDGGAKLYDFGDVLTIGDTDRTLYGTWTLATYTISYNANGGSGAPASQTKTGGTPITLSSTVPTRDGYSFLGWAKSATGTAVYQPGDSFTEEADTTLYAVWEEFGGLMRVATHEGIRTAKVYVQTEGGLKRARAYVMTANGLKEGK